MTAAREAGSCDRKREFVSPSQRAGVTRSEDCIERIRDQIIGTMLRPRMITTEGSTKPQASGVSPNSRFISGDWSACSTVGRFSEAHIEDEATSDQPVASAALAV